MKALIIDNHSKFIQNIKNILDNFKIENSIIDFADFHMDMTGSFDCFILSGESLSIKNTPAFRDEKELIKQAPKPIFSICFGFQTTSYVYSEITSEIKFS
ncbi:MAG: hypothetical protein KAW88_08100 [Candidatus Cloacimonetes bacterium]|nr:hypothetical protein [Candidatus Cloacimonadota bacterium]